MPRFKLAQARQERMAERRRNRRKYGSYQAVLTEKPQRTKPRKHRAKDLICSDCGQQTTITIADYWRAARPRCPACGGPLNLPRLA
jgi:ribosomal protein L44E